MLLKLSQTFNSIYLFWSLSNKVVLAILQRLLNRSVPGRMGGVWVFGDGLVLPWFQGRLECFIGRGFRPFPARGGGKQLSRLNRRVKRLAGDDLGKQRLRNGEKFGKF